MRPVADSSRTESAYRKMPLVMSANVNPGFIHNRQRYLQSETARAYAFQKAGPVEKDHHFVKDPVKQFVEKALELHDGEAPLSLRRSPPPSLPPPPFVPL